MHVVNNDGQAHGHLMACSIVHARRRNWVGPDWFWVGFVRRLSSLSIPCRGSLPTQAASRAPTWLRGWASSSRTRSSSPRPELCPSPRPVLASLILLHPSPAARRRVSSQSAPCRRGTPTPPSSPPPRRPSPSPPASARFVAAMVQLRLRA